MKHKSSTAPLFALLIAACSNAPVAPPSAGHIEAEAQAATPPATSIPQPVQNTVTPPKPKAAAKVETYSVVVNNVRVHDLLFALARDAKVNVDIHPGISGNVTLNAIDQTLPQILNRISKQVEDMRWEIDGMNLVVMPDSPSIRTYKIDYVNLTRETENTISVTTQVASTGAGASTSSGASGAAGGNNSLTSIKSASKNHFWKTLEQNIKDILNEQDKTRWEVKCEQQKNATGNTNSSNVGNTVVPATGVTVATSGPGSESESRAVDAMANSQQQCGAFVEKALVIANPETGTIAVRATSRQHERVQDFLSQVMASARRQVLIEATIAEVTLSDNFQQGIDWSGAKTGSKGFTVTQTGTTVSSNILQLAYNNATSSLGSIASAVRLLDDFGTVKVLSSPKISVLNNQTAVLKVVDNLVYFTIKADTTTSNTSTNTTYTTTINSVPVGLVMSVTPQISENDTVLLNIRPSISRKYDEVADPNPALKSSSLTATITSMIPVIRTREMESMIRVENGNIAVMGGLMEDSQENSDSAVPALSRVPIFGSFFQNKNDTRRKTELVIFLRPIVVKNASLDGDYASYRNQLPRQDFFNGKVGPNSRFGNDGGWK